MAKQKTSEPLTGTALLQKVKTLATLSKTQKAKACGYYTVTKGGVERINLPQFLKALIRPCCRVGRTPPMFRLALSSPLLSPFGIESATRFSLASL